jgi:hypothetical protein
MSVRSLWNRIFKKKQTDEEKEQAEAAYSKALCTLFSKIMRPVLHDNNLSNELGQFISVKDVLQNDIEIGGAWSMDITFKVIILKFFNCRMNDTQKVIELNNFSSEELIAQIKLQIKKFKIEDKKKALEKDFK